jgi:hypothetical protein
MTNALGVCFCYGGSSYQGKSCAPSYTAMCVQGGIAHVRMHIVASDALPALAGANRLRLVASRNMQVPLLVLSRLLRSAMECGGPTQ